MAVALRAAAPEACYREPPSRPSTDKICYHRSSRRQVVAEEALNRAPFPRAVASKADYLVTGNMKHFPATHAGVPQPHSDLLEAVARSI
jgi:hypothetical protein